MSELRYAIRRLLRSPGFAVVSIVTLGLGIGLNTAIFSLVNAALLRPLPVAEQQELYSLFGVRDDGSTTRSISYPDYVFVRENAASFSSLAVSGEVSAIWRNGTEDLRLDGYLVSANYFETLGIQPVLGRGFREEEDQTPGAFPVVVIGHDFWQRSLEADPQVIGQVLTLNGAAFTVVGVAPPRFHGLRTLGWGDFWTPTAMQPVIRPGDEHLTRGHRWMQAVGRLAPGNSAASAGAELTVLHEQLAQQFPDTFDGRALQAQPLTGLPGDRQTTVRAFSLLMGVVGLVLLIACANVANLFLERAVSRRREIAVRLAIGGSRRRIVAPLLAEAAVVAAAGGLLGLLLGLWATDAFRLVESSVGRVGLDFSLDLRVLGFTAAATMLTVALFGLAPAAQALRVPIVPALGARGDGDGSPLKLGLRKSLVVAQVGVCLVLLVAAGLFARSLTRIARLDPGFRTDGLMLTSFDLEKHGYDDERGRQFVRRTLAELRSIPGVSSATVTHSPPFGFVRSATFLQPASAGADVPAAELRNRYRVEYAQVGTSYFETMGIGLVAGRDFTDRDRQDRPSVAIVNQTLAAEYWPGENAIGKMLDQPGSDEAFEVVGVVRDSKYFELTEDSRRFCYFPVDQSYRAALTLVTHADMDLAPLASAVRERLAGVDPDVALFGVNSMEGYLGQALMMPRLVAGLLTAFAGLGLLLAAVGVYGLISYAVTRRRREVGIRLALGASSREVIRLVLRDSLKLTLIGAGLGLVTAIGAGRLARDLLFETSPSDPLTLAGTALLLIVTAAAAALFPALKAARVQPSEALRSE